MKKQPVDKILHCSHRLLCNFQSITQIAKGILSINSYYNILQLDILGTVYKSIILSDENLIRQ
jgi:hypothetical protein